MQDQCVFINKEGKELTHYKYHAIGAFSNGLAQISLFNKIGLINTNGIVVVEPTYAAIGEFDDDIAPVIIRTDNNEYLGYIDIHGRKYFQNGK
jgi:hypothetical protein